MRKLCVCMVVPFVCAVVATAAYAKPPSKASADLSGEQEVPGVATALTGSCQAKFDKSMRSVDVTLKVSDASDVAAAHFHCGLAGENGPVALGIVGPLTFQKNRAKGTLTNADFSAGNNCVTQIGRTVENVAALAFAIRDGLIYCNVHTSANPGGEIRGQMSE